MRLILRNAQLILKEAVVFGSIVIEDGIIADIHHGAIHWQDGLDLDGDYLLPGLIDLHSDNLEKHLAPRPNVVWSGSLAAIAHDADVIGVGITTVLDAIALSGGKNGDRERLCHGMFQTLQEAQDRDCLRAEHLLHIRCELTDARIVERFEAVRNDPRVRMISLMDHSPGQRVFRDVAMWRDYRKKGRGMSDEALDEAFRREVEAHKLYSAPNRAALGGIAKGQGFVVATHDDATRPDVLEGVSAGSTLAEFPTTLEAARCARECGISNILGAPNILRGNSHVDNVSALSCAAEGLLDILTSDYMPVSLLQAAFKLARSNVGYDIPRSVATVTCNPAEALGLRDRGEISVGKRADLLQVREARETPVVKRVWRNGSRVH
jgi:alpha-D-ribose 1-methylphosphonate 5-triphosphate diphosphatase